ALKIIDWGVARDTDVPIESYAVSAACTLEFIDEAWFCNGGHPSLESDMYAACWCLMQEIKVEADEALDREKERLRDETERQQKRFQDITSVLGQDVSRKSFTDSLVKVGKSYRWKYQELALSYSPADAEQIFSYLGKKKAIEEDSRDIMKMVGLDERRKALNGERDVLKERFDYGLQMLVTGSPDFDFDEFIETCAERDGQLGWLFEDVFMTYEDHELDELHTLRQDTGRWKDFATRWDKLRHIAEDTMTSNYLPKGGNAPVNNLFQAWNMLTMHIPLMRWLNMSPPGKRTYSKTGEEIRLYHDCTQQIGERLDEVRALPEEQRLDALVEMLNVLPSGAEEYRRNLVEALEVDAESSNKIWADVLTTGYPIYDIPRLGRGLKQVADYVTAKDAEADDNRQALDRETAARDIQQYLHDMIDAYMKPPLEIINNYHDKTFEMLIEMIDSGILQMRRRVPGLVYAGLRKPAERFSLARGTPEVSLTPLKFLAKFMDFYAQPERYGQGDVSNNRWIVTEPEHAKLTDL
ncbi:TPA: hypothetical protein HA265_07865, partial [Candidatus Woesearchaeota archaeon]|nr:hypothetical protein [Candidatus Woesearchaeota archaeon]